MRHLCFGLLAAVPTVVSAAGPAARLVSDGTSPVLPVSAPDTLGDRLRRELTPWLESQAKSGAFSGVVLVARNGQPIFSAAYGMADRARTPSS